MLKIDFYVEVIDNFGDLGFAYNIALLLVSKKENIFIRFFCNNKKLFKKISGEKNTTTIKYYDLKKSFKLKPNKLIINFFDKKINYNYLHKFDFDIKIINFTYFSIHKGSHSLHETKVNQKNLNIIYFVPSILKDTGGIIINNIKRLTKEEISLKFSFPNHNKKWISIFVYEDTFQEIKEELLLQKDYLFFIFDSRNKLSGENIIQMPFLEINEYYDFLGVCDKNIVRGENSLISGILSNKSFLWDIYKEPNNAHVYKIDDFGDFFGDLEFKEILKIFNIKNKVEGLKKFLNYENEKLFNEKSNYIKNNCDLINNLEKLILDL